MEYYRTQETSNPEIVTHIWIDNDNSLHGICVDKNISIEEAYQKMINYVEPIESPLGLS